MELSAVWIYVCVQMNVYGLRAFFRTAAVVSVRCFNSFFPRNTSTGPAQCCIQEGWVSMCEGGCKAGPLDVVCTVFCVG